MGSMLMYILLGVWANSKPSLIGSFHARKPRAMWANVVIALIIPTFIFDMCFFGQSGFISQTEITLLLLMILSQIIVFFAMVVHDVGR